MKFKWGWIVFGIILVNVFFIGIRYLQLQSNIEKFLEPNPNYPASNKSEKNNQQISTATIQTNTVRKNINKVETPVFPKIAIVLDDLGIKTVDYNLLDKIPYKLNLAIIPGMKDSRMLVKEYAQDGRYEILLHMPMQPIIRKEDQESRYIEHPRRYPYILETKQTAKQMIKQLDSALDSLEGSGIVVGFNNHMGSAITSSKNIMNTVLNWGKSRELYFLDSMTTAATVGYELAKKKKMPALYNEVFLDGTATEEYIENQLAKARRLASKNGYVVVIGHITREKTLETLVSEMPRMAEEGYEFVFLSDILKLSKK
ncbi:MAG: divergent polysaccharide deacetylase family protein [Candidatus Margulisbacteria bacterium]|nr:divergent polysaccharide deacetylase family protein [Candidatus Margulisiibacteriota bacterium]